MRSRVIILFGKLSALHSFNRLVQKWSTLLCQKVAHTCIHLHYIDLQLCMLHVKVFVIIVQNAIRFMYITKTGWTFESIKVRKILCQNIIIVFNVIDAHEKLSRNKFSPPALRNLTWIPSIPNRFDTVFRFEQDLNVHAGYPMRHLMLRILLYPQCLAALSRIFT